MKIRRYRYPEVYEVRFTYSNGSNTIRYHATPEGDDGMVLEYSERFVNPRPASGVMARLQLKWYERRSRPPRRAHHRGQSSGSRAPTATSSSPTRL